MNRLFATSLASFMILGTALIAPASAAEYPQRPVTLVVPWPPGDLEDQLTRIIADEMTAETKKPAKVVNKPGGGAVEGATYVFQAKPDGYTVGSFVIDVPTVHVIKGIAPYKRDSFEPVGIFLTYPFGLVANKDAPYSTLKELADYSKSHPVKLGHFGYDVIPTMATFKAAKELGIVFAADVPSDMLDCSTLASGDIQVINTTMATVLPCLDKVKVLAAYTDTPLSLFPDAPLLRDAAPGNDVTLWNGLFVPKGTPQEVKDKIAAIAKTAMESDRAKDIAKNTGAGVYWMGEAEAKARIDADYAKTEALAAAQKQ